jgi:urea transport system permease protein
VLGAFGVNALKSWATRAYPDLWLIFLGALFVLVTVFMPKGLVGLPEQVRDLKHRFDARRAKRALVEPAIGPGVLPADENQVVKTE